MQHKFFKISLFLLCLFFIGCKEETPPINHFVGKWIASSKSEIFEEDTVLVYGTYTTDDEWVFNNDQTGMLKYSNGNNNDFLWIYKEQEQIMYILRESTSSFGYSMQRITFPIIENELDRQYWRLEQMLGDTVTSQKSVWEIWLEKEK